MDLMALSQMEHFMSLVVLWTSNGHCVHVSIKYTDFSVQKGARERPLCGYYAPSIRTSAEPALGRAPQQTSTQYSKQHYVTKVQTQKKTARV